MTHQTQIDLDIDNDTLAQNSPIYNSPTVIPKTPPRLSKTSRRDLLPQFTQEEGEHENLGTEYPHWMVSEGFVGR